MSPAEVEWGVRDKNWGSVRFECGLVIAPGSHHPMVLPTAHNTCQICDPLVNIQKGPWSPLRLFLQMKFTVWNELNLHRKVPPAVFFLFSFLSRDLLEVDFWWLACSYCYPQISGAGLNWNSEHTLDWQGQGGVWKRRVSMDSTAKLTFSSLVVPNSLFDSKKVYISKECGLFQLQQEHILESLSR